MTFRLESLRHALIVSCQAPAGSPLRDTDTMRRVAEAALASGAQGVRLNGPDDVRAVRAVTGLPIIGLYKVATAARNIITPTLGHARLLVEAGADIVALDCTREVHPDSFGIVASVKGELGCLVMADVSTLEEGVAAWEAGADLVGTTLSGYTPYTRTTETGGPDLELVAALASRGIRTVAEGRYARPEQVAAALERGAFAVVVGGAITDPMSITRRFVAALPGGAP